ncbi:MAG: DUF4450 domain-containing protein [Duncaniella sp.]|nr:DUF4450 domain-containing protein [Duncaniella sp.]
MKLLSTAAAMLLPFAVMGQSYIGMFDHNPLERSDKRVLQYTPTSDGYIMSHNGKNLYTRALYGGNTAFRMETSDMPIFAGFHGKDNRNIHFVLDVDGVKMRLDSVSDCRSYYRGGERRYELTDAAWRGGRIVMTLLAPRDYEGGIWKIEAAGMPKGSTLTAVSCATVKIKLNRNGDMGADPANCLAPDPERGDLTECTVNLGGKKQTVYIGYADRVVTAADQKKLAAAYAKADRQRADLAGMLEVETPDPYFNTLGATIMNAADGNWDGQVWLHGAIGWRMPLSGWRGAYNGDFLGWHDRARSHFDAYAKSQVTDVEPVIPHPSQDSDKQMARALKKWGTQMYSNGYICRNPERNDQMHHYDMNLCYIDELLWHLKWTGDLDYARERWNTLKSHLAWEKRNFDPDDDGLYDAYCCIWASDALYYNSGAVTHSTAYNYRANKIAAEIAEKIGEDAEPYRKEADKILAALNSTLWMEDKGVWAEHKDFMGHKRLHDHPALWTVYHAIDSDVADPFMAYSATRYVDNNIPHIPVVADGLEDGEYATVSTTDWLPYAWSINNVAFAEVLHTTLAYWQAGRPEAASKLFKSSMLDGMYMGNSPGNIGQISFYDAARGECYRDFADPTAMMARAVVQGLFGFNPDALNHTLLMRPGFPREWEHASIRHSDFTLGFKREGYKDVYSLTLALDSIRTVDFILRAPFDKVKSVMVNGKPTQWSMVENSIDLPAIKVSTPVSGKMDVAVEWDGTSVANAKVAPTGKVRKGFRQVKSGDMCWWEETESFRHQPLDAARLGLDLKVTPEDVYETIDLTPYYNANVTDIFRNEYLSPRSPYTTLQIPVHGIGEWCHPDDMAEIDDSGLRNAMKAEGVVNTSLGIPFASVAEGKNAVYTSLFDNYPDSASMPLSGRASAIQLLMAGSTNHMQCHSENARVKVKYADGTETVLPLIAPNNWCPIEQDYFTDGKAFKLSTPRPYRMILKDASVTDNVAEALDIKGVYGRRIDEGAGILLRVDLDAHKELQSLTLETLSNEIVAGILAATYVR